MPDKLIELIVYVLDNYSDYLPQQVIDFLLQLIG